MSRRAFLQRRGTAALEFAIVLPVVIILLVGIADLGRMIWVQGTLEYATAAAARCAAINPTDCGTPAQIQAYAVTKAYGMTEVDPAQFGVASAACGRQVTGSARLTLFTPWMALRSVNLQANACYPSTS